jgi:hypothetical protein
LQPTTTKPPNQQLRLLVLVLVRKYEKALNGNKSIQGL